MDDIKYIEDLKKLIEKEKVPAPAPIEQRWTACSKSPMSPASSSSENYIFSWGATAPIGARSYSSNGDDKEKLKSQLSSKRAQWKEAQRRWEPFPTAQRPQIAAQDQRRLLVGIIMYLPTSDARQRKEITEEFFHYRHLTQTQLWDQYSAYEHWAKIEVPKDKEELATLQARLRKRLPIDEYNKARKELDPSGILSNNMLEKLFPISNTV